MLTIHVPGALRTVPLTTEGHPLHALYEGVRLRVLMLDPATRNHLELRWAAAARTGEDDAARSAALTPVWQDYLEATVRGIEGVEYDGAGLADIDGARAVAVLAAGGMVPFAARAASDAQQPTRAQKNS